MWGPVPRRPAITCSAPSSHPHSQIRLIPTQSPKPTQTQTGVSGVKVPSAWKSCEVKGDTDVEPDETVILWLNNLRTDDHRVYFDSGTKMNTEATGTITNDD